MCTACACRSRCGHACALACSLHLRSCMHTCMSSLSMLACMQDCKCKEIIHASALACVGCACVCAACAGFNGRASSGGQMHAQGHFIHKDGQIACDSTSYKQATKCNLPRILQTLAMLNRLQSRLRKWIASPGRGESATAQPLLRLIPANIYPLPSLTIFTLQSALLR